jgi:hypothetical protein
MPKKRPVLSALQQRALETSIRRAVGQLSYADCKQVHKKHYSGKSTYTVPR